MTNPVRIGNRTIGPGLPCFIIAEGGVNHNGDPALAHKLIDEAKAAGADCVKFQTFSADALVTAQAPKADYQLLQTDPRESQWQMLKRLELPTSAYGELLDHCRQAGILFMSTPYGFEDVDFLANLGVEAFKIASGQLTEHPFLAYAATKGKPLIVSTGMADENDVTEAISAARTAGCNDLIVLQCTSNYPSKVEDANLRVIPSWIRRLSTPIGYSDHTIGIETALASVALGACVVEKHFTLDKKMEGPDHACSSDPKELAALVASIRRVEAALGSDTKTVLPIEARNAKGMKRSLAAAGPIAKGTVLRPEMFTFKRPASGIPPKLLASVVGKTAREDIAPNTIVTYAMVGLEAPESR